MRGDRDLREHLLRLLGGGMAHVTFEKAVAGMKEGRRGKKARGVPYSPWQQVEHMRIAQWDILEYIRNPRHVAPEWPEGYWPKAAPPRRDAWDKSIRAFKADLRGLKALVADPSTNLTAQIPHAQRGHTILREVLVAADHTAYHLGQLVVLRRLLGDWRE
ncbi:MAG: DinB family protein [Armatimonadota bacterium]